MNWLAQALAWVLFSLAGYAAPLLPQNAAPDQKARTADQTIRVNVNLVQTDVTVFDSDGRFVDGLSREQFELRVDGTPQPVEFFELVNAGSSQDERHWSPPAPGPFSDTAMPAGPTASDRGRSLFFFVDDLHLSAGSIPRVRDSLLYAINRTMALNDQAAIVLASGRGGFLEQLTDTKQVLRSVVSRLNYWDSGILDNERPLMQEHQALAIQQNNSDVIAVFVEATMRENGFDQRRRAIAQQIVRSRAQTLVTRSADVTRRTLVSLENLLQGSAALPRRKLIFLLSDGFALQPQASDVLARLKAVSDAAARGGTVIYSIDARGLVPDVPDASTSPFTDALGRLKSATGSSISTTESGMYNVAAATGGRFLHNTNALNQAIVRTLAETSRAGTWRMGPTQPGNAAPFR
jgi:VWFA-related protein